MVHQIRHVARWCIKLDMLLDGGSLQAAGLSDLKLDMMLDSGSLQAARRSDLKLDMMLDGASN